jgi:uncharacterized protein (DUF2132 family)
MEDEVNYRNNPLHSIGLKVLLNELVDHYGFDILSAYLSINCFKVNPSIESSIKFLKKTEWAREKVEAFYLYEFKNLPRASDEQFLLPPRERIIPEQQKPGEPAELSIEDAERLAEKRAKKWGDKGRGGRQGSNSGYAPKDRASSRHKSSTRSHAKSDEKASASPAPAASERVAKDIAKGKVDPWANARNRKKT